MTETTTTAVQGIHDTEGTWIVETETSRYLLDLDGLTATRLPGRGAGPVEGLPPAHLLPLRLDEQPIPILGIVKVEVGSPMVLQLSIRDGFLTYRRTTIVRTITRCE